MKKVCMTGLVLLTCMLSMNEAEAQSEENVTPTKIESVDMTATEVHLTVEGMTCQAGCADGIDKMLDKKAGVSKSKTTYESGSSVIWYDKNVISEKEILAMIADKGFKATVNKNDQVDPD